jgi:hypothetical protein
LCWRVSSVGLYGSRDPMHNLLPLTFWSLLWVGLTLASMLLGNLWRAINPWTGPVRIVRALIGRTGGGGPLAPRAYWPAVLGYLRLRVVRDRVAAARGSGGAGPRDPGLLAGDLRLAVIEGEDWLKRGEAFLTVFYGFIARIAPFWLRIEGEPRGHDDGLARRADRAMPIRCRPRPWPS